MYSGHLSPLRSPLFFNIKVWTYQMSATRIVCYENHMCIYLCVGLSAYLWLSIHVNWFSWLSVCMCVLWLCIHVVVRAPFVQFAHSVLCTTCLCVPHKCRCPSWITGHRDTSTFWTCLARCSEEAALKRIRRMGNGATCQMFKWFFVNRSILRSLQWAFLCH